MSENTFDLVCLLFTILLILSCALFTRGSINYIKDQKLSRFCSIPSKPVRASKFYVFLVGPMLALQYTEVFTYLILLARFVSKYIVLFSTF